jgi:hypothetical protein
MSRRPYTNVYFGCPLTENDVDKLIDFAYSQYKQEEPDGNFTKDEISDDLFGEFCDNLYDEGILYIDNTHEYWDVVSLEEKKDCYCLVSLPSQKAAEGYSIVEVSEKVKIDKEWKKAIQQFQKLNNLSSTKPKWFSFLQYG